MHTTVADTGWVGVLGPIRAHRDGGDDDVVPGGTRLRGLLARLALDAGRPVGVSTLLDDLWGDRLPESAANALQSLVSRLRRALGAGTIVTAPGGYRLDVGPDGVDALRFAALRREAGAGDPVRAVALLREALALWRGPALADVRELPFAGPAAARLDEQRAGAVEELAVRGRETGDPGTGLDELTALLAAQPLRESAAVALARGLAATGRQADALAVLDRTREALAGELGVDPGPELTTARTMVLRGEPAPVNGAGAAAPPVRVAARPPALTSFVGRDADVARVRALLDGSRLVTVTGPGGAGKTRLATEALAGRAGPVATVELASLSGREQIVGALLHAVGGPELVLGDPAGPSPDERLRATLAGRELALLLDNCEHVVDDVAALVHDLLASAPGLRVLATSREPLHVPGEMLHPLGALAEPDAVRLFADRAAAVRPGFEVTGADARPVAEICRRLDGQPLPIELAAARTRTLSPAEIAARLDDRFRLLTGGARTVLPRHQTLRAVVDWSWELLGPGERRLAQRLGVFAGPVDVDTIEAVCGPGLDGDVLDLVGALVDRSLVTVVPDAGDAAGPTRYAMLETIREYASSRLAESGERDELVAAHADRLLDVLETAEPLLRTRDQLTHLAAIRRLAGETTRALRRAIDAGDAVRAHRLLAGLSWSWAVRGEWRTAQQLAEDVWTLPVPADLPAVAVNRTFRALMRASYGDAESAYGELDALDALLPGLPEPRHPIVELAQPVRRAFTDGDESGLARLAESGPTDWLRGIASQALATLAENRGDVDRERAMLRVAYRCFQATGERFGLGMTVFSLGELEDLAGEADAADALFTEAVHLARELGNVDDLPQFLMRLALLAARRGDAAAARRYMAETDAVPAPREQPWSGLLDMSRAEIERRLGNTAVARELVERSEPVMDEPGPGRDQRRAYVLLTRAAVDLDDGRTDAAAELLARAAERALDSSDGPVLAAVAEASARCAVAAGRPERAAELLGVATARRGTLHRGDPEVTATHDAVEAALGREATAAAMERGAALPPDHPPGPHP